MIWQSSIWFYILPFLVSFIIIHPLVWWVKRLALHFEIIDRPDQGRKFHPRPVPLLGGLATGLVFLICLLIFLKLGFILDGRIDARAIWGLVLATFLLIIGGVLDDTKHLTPGRQFIWPVLAGVVILFSGIQVDFITNPLGGLLRLDNWSYTWGSYVFYPVALSASFFWILGMIYTTKFLDGLDGLVSGMTVIGAVVIFIVSLAWDIPYSGTSVLALIVAGTMLGFLFWNFNPAKIFLGEAGSTLAGLWLGVLAIISGGKIATALLVMGLPILDVAWVIWQRIFMQKKSPTSADRSHLHFRLLDLGLSQKQAVLLLYLLACLFGSIALFQNTKGKLILMGGLVLLMVFIVAVLIKIKR
jgi:UDP-GlcNAc:undecaprenyl-phosphate GlcNAc-1-phosphate transferase